MKIRIGRAGPIGPILTVVCVAAAWGGAADARAADPPAFATEASATIHPGVMTRTEGSQCTSNFVFYDATTTYLGQAAHCSGTGAANETDGCLSKSLPVGTAVEIDGATRPGRLAYNSWIAMQAAGEKDPDACSYNDFALVAIDPADVGRVSPALPTFGVPTGLNTTGVAAGEQIRTYGNSGLRLGLAALSPKTGFSLGQGGGGWLHTVYTITPGIPGDSGSGFIDAGGRAFGVLSTVALLPLPASNGVADLSRALAYLKAHGGPDVVLADTSRTAAPVPATAGPAATTSARARQAAQNRRETAKARRLAVEARRRSLATRATRRP